MIIFVSKTSNTANKKPFNIERLTQNLCMNPIYSGIKTEFPCNILLDSGAFQDTKKRLTFQQAIDRQLDFQKTLGYSANYVVAYDRIGEPIETMQANRFLVDYPLEQHQKKVLVCQGKNISEYSECCKELLELSHSSEFVLGFGGIAKIGMTNHIEDKLFGAISRNHENFDKIKHIHLFGVLTKRIIRKIESTFPDKQLSCDTAGIEVKSVMGNVFTNGVWRKKYPKREKFKVYHPNDLAQENIRRVLEYYGNDCLQRRL